MEIVWPGPASPFGLLKKSIILLNHDDLLVLPSTPVEVVPKPGNRKVIHFISGIATKSIDWVSYTNIDADGPYAAFTFDANNADYVSSLAINNTGASTTSLSKLFGDLFMGGSSQLEFPPLALKIITGYGNQAIVNGTDRNNAPLQFAVVDNAADFTGGHVNNKMKITAFYTIVDL